MPPKLLSPQTEQSQLSHPVFIWKMLQSLSHLCGPLLGSLQYVHVSLVPVRPVLNSTPARPLQCWAGRKDVLPPAVGSLGCCCLFCQEGAFLAPWWCMGLFLSRWRTEHFPLLNFKRSFSAQFPSLSRSLSMTAQPSGVWATPHNLLSADLLRVSSVPVCSSLMELLNCLGHSIDPWGTGCPLPGPGTSTSF